MNVHPNDLYRMISDVEDASRKQLAKCHELRMMLATFDLPKPAPGFVCREASCGVSRPTAKLLEEHLENVHGILAPAPPGVVDEFAPAQVGE